MIRGFDPTAALCALVITSFALWLLQPVAQRLNLLDHPAGRKDHAAATPVTGGIAILIGCVASFFAVQTSSYALLAFCGAGLLLVDVQLAEGSGFGVCAYARSRGLPVIFLTASGDESSVVLGLDMGADDYIAKPFRPRELVSRIRSVLRRYGKEKTLVPLGGVVVDTEKGRVTRDGRDVYLSALEYRLLLVFLSHRGKVLSRSQLLEEIWDAAGDFVNDNTLTVYIKRLREKIETDPADPQIIRTVRGIGYMVDA